MPRFLITVFFVFFVSLAAVVGIILFIVPSQWSLFVLLLLIGATVNFGLSAISYLFSKPSRFESEKQQFRRIFKRSAWVGFIVLVLILAQIVFDVL